MSAARRVPQRWFANVADPMRRFHPIAEIFPLLEGDEFDSLVESVRTRGLLNAIWTHPDDGSIIDGRNRERACARAGVEPRYQTWDGKGSLAAFVVAQNVERRHLTATQKAKLGKALMPLLAAEAKERQQSGKSADGTAGGRGNKTLPKKLGKVSHEGEAVEQAAKLAHTNRKYIADLVKIEKEAPEVYAKIEAGDIELPKAKRLLVKVEAEKKLLAAGAIVRPAIETCDLRVCSMQELLGELRGLDAIITDPPYEAAAVPLYGELARLARKALKPNGVLCVMTGGCYLPDILTRLTQHMTWRCGIAYMMPGQATQVFARKVNCNWKPVLVFGGDKWITRDVVEAEKDKRFHDQGQGEGGIGRIVDMLTEPDALVCDPFLGAGTTAVACVKLHRRVLGCDVDAAQVETARKRCALAFAVN
jgi:hypothetical protein